MTYAPPNTTSHFFQCGNKDCATKFIAFENAEGKWEWELREENTFNNLLKGVKKRQERNALKEEKGKLTQEKGQLEKMIADNPKKIAVIKKEMENIKTQVNKLTDEYEKRGNQYTNLEEAMKRGKR